MHKIEKEDFKAMVANFHEHRKAGTLKVDRTGEIFDAKEIAQLDLTNKLNVHFGATKEGHLRVILSDGTTELEKGACCP